VSKSEWHFFAQQRVNQEIEDCTSTVPYNTRVKKVDEREETKKQSRLEKMGFSNVIQRVGGVAVFAVVLFGVSIPTETTSHVFAMSAHDGDVTSETTSAHDGDTGTSKTTVADAISNNSTLSDAMTTTLLQENSDAERELGGYRASAHEPMTRDNCLSPIQQCAYFDMTVEFNYTNSATNFCPPTPDVAPFDDRVTCVDVRGYCEHELQCGNNGGIFPDCCEQCYQR
jgi:hypothetical protein